MAQVRPRGRRTALVAPPRPSVVAHRGASSSLAEHTLGAYVAAIESGADGLECDVRLTRDGHLVCVHDRTVNRTSDGSGAVSELDLAGLQALDFASWHTTANGSVDRAGSGEADPAGARAAYLSGVAPDRTGDGTVLTLERLLGLVHDAERPVRLLIETKHPTRYAGLVEKQLVELLARFGWAGRPEPPVSLRQPVEAASRVVVMSFAPTALRRVKLLAPDIPTVLLMDRRLPGLRDGLLPAGVPIAGPGLSIVRADPGFVARAHARGHQVFVWTVNDARDVDYVCGLGVDALITDRPMDALARLGAADRRR